MNRRHPGDVMYRCRSVLLLRRMIIIMGMGPIGDRRWGLLGGGRGGIMSIMSELLHLFVCLVGDDHIF